MKIKNIKKVINTTKPYKMGDNLLILATSPDVQAYFDDENVRSFFGGYDVAFINKMPLCSEDAMHVIRPKYIMFMDNIFYEDSVVPNGEPNERKKWVEQVLSKINWKCYIVTPSLARFAVHNKNLEYLRLSILEARYSFVTKLMYKKNHANVGFNNVVMGAIYYGITFGYKNIALMGFSYQNGKKHMDVDGLHIEGYPHYYDLETHPRIVPTNELFDGKKSYTLRIAERTVESEKKLCELARYAADMGVRVVNYTPNNCVTVFPTKKLEIDKAEKHD